MRGNTIKNFNNSCPEADVPVIIRRRRFDRQKCLRVAMKQLNHEVLLCVCVCVCVWISLVEYFLNFIIKLLSHKISKKAKKKRGLKSATTLFTIHQSLFTCPPIAIAQGDCRRAIHQFTLPVWPCSVPEKACILYLIF